MLTKLERIQASLEKIDNLINDVNKLNKNETLTTKKELVDALKKLDKAALETIYRKCSNINWQEDFGKQVAYILSFYLKVPEKLNSNTANSVVSWLERKVA